MTFYYLLLGHLIGDFALQTNKIAENKGKQWKWNFIHVLVVTLSIFVFSFPFGILFNLLVVFNGIAHFILDHYKNEIRKLFHLSELVCFLVDQTIHILLLFLISRIFLSSDSYFVDIVTVKFLIVLALVTYFSAVFTQFVLAALFPRLEGRFFEKGEKSIGILTRLYMSIVFYLSFAQSSFYLALLLIAVASSFLQYKLGWNKWMSRSHLGVKLLLDIFISAACVLIIIL